MQPQTNKGENEGGEITVGKGSGSDLSSDVTIDVYGNSIRFFAVYNNTVRNFNIDFKSKTTYWT